jgi:pyruvate kinase
MTMSLEALLEALLNLRHQLETFEQEQADLLNAVASPYRASARNLLHFIAFHQHNHPGLQASLRERGLSTLAGCDPHLLASLSILIGVVQSLLGHPSAPEPVPAGAGAAVTAPDAPLSFAAGHALLRRNGEQLLGSCNAIMVTLPAEAANAPALVDELVAAGMDIARINCAHDNPAIWAALARQVRGAAARHGRACRIAMDLAGPKLRTANLPALPGVIAARPQRDRYGRLLQPARILAGLPGSPGPAAASAEGGAQAAELVRLPVQGADWGELSCGDRLRSRDASGRWRELVVREQGADGLVLHCRQHCRFVSGLVFRQEGGPATLTVAPLPDSPGELLLQCGQRLRLTTAAEAAQEPEPTAPPAIACTLAEVLEELAVDDRVLFDDGKIAARVVALAPAGSAWVELEITQARPRGSRLRADKGINLPDTTLRTPALTAKDLEDLTFACRHADLINYSFVRSEADIACLQAAMAAQVPAGETVRTGLVLKIETRQAFQNLPRLLLAAMTQPTTLGVMIARGDLAIECGWEALSGIQEEILRTCAAAHVPCIWATQVLETMAQHGTPTRPEITDAAMGARAEALMLNKGANITGAVRSLRQIVERSGITRSDNSTDQPDQMLCCLSF